MFNPVIAMLLCGESEKVKVSDANILVFCFKIFNHKSFMRPKWSMRFFLRKFEWLSYMSKISITTKPLLFFRMLLYSRVSYNRFSTRQMLFGECFPQNIAFLTTFFYLWKLFRSFPITMCFSVVNKKRKFPKQFVRY